MGSSKENALTQALELLNESKDMIHCALHHIVDGKFHAKRVQHALKLYRSVQLLIVNLKDDREAM